MNKDLLHIIAPISNPERYRSRTRLHIEFTRHMQAAQANLHVVELAFGNRPFVVTDQTEGTNVQLRTPYEIWHKENLINLTISRLPADWKYVAWLDTDISFMRPDWIEETIQQLQHYQIVQMFQTAIDMGPTGETLSRALSFAYCYVKGMKYHGGDPPYYYQASGADPTTYYWHPGYAWAARREAIDHMGGLMDRAVLGAGDHHMALALMGAGQMSMPGKINPRYRDYVMAWQNKAEYCARRNFGYVPGTIVHNWHGKKRDRRYVDRWKIITDNDFDPVRDLKRDWQGLYQLCDDGTRRSIRLRDQIRAYFRGRNEDSIDLE